MINKSSKKILSVLIILFFFTNCESSRHLPHSGTDHKRIGPEDRENPLRSERNYGRIHFEITSIADDSINFKYKNLSKDTLLAVFCSSEIFYLGCSEEYYFPATTEIFIKTDSLTMIISRGFSPMIKDGQFLVDQLPPGDSIMFKVELLEGVIERIKALDGFQVVNPKKYISPVDESKVPTHIHQRYNSFYLCRSGSYFGRAIIPSLGQYQRQKLCCYSRIIPWTTCQNMQIQ